MFFKEIFIYLAAPGCAPYIGGVWRLGHDDEKSLGVTFRLFERPSIKFQKTFSRLSELRKSWELAVGIHRSQYLFFGAPTSGLAALSLCWLSYPTKESKCTVSHRTGGPLEALCSEAPSGVVRPCHKQ